MFENDHWWTSTCVDFCDSGPFFYFRFEHTFSEVKKERKMENLLIFLIKNVSNSLIKSFNFSHLEHR